MRACPAWVTWNGAAAWRTRMGAVRGAVVALVAAAVLLAVLIADDGTVVGTLDDVLIAPVGGLVLELLSTVEGAAVFAMLQNMFGNAAACGA